MIRKQIYIEVEQQDALARRARVEGVSEAAVIRRSLDLASRASSHRRAPDAAAWPEALAFMRSLARRGGKPAGRDWTREDLYEERLTRYGRRSL